MVSKQVGAIFTILGGVFYILGSFVGVLLTAAMSGFAYGLSGLYNQNPASGLSNSLTLATVLWVFGIFSGVLIIAGGALINSDSSERRKAGGILALAMMILGAIPAFGGAIIGFVFTLLGSVIGLTYKGGPDIVVGTIDMSPPAPEPPAMEPQTPIYSTSGRSQRTRFCIKCGQALHQGAVFCGACGAPVPQD